MPTVTLQAHYDGQHILLDEPFELPPNARLMVTVLPVTDMTQETRFGQTVATPDKPTRTAYQLAEEIGLVGAFEN